MLDNLTSVQCILLLCITLFHKCTTHIEAQCSQISGHIPQQSEPLNCTHKWSELLSTLREGSQEEFKEAIWPFANATKNSYTWRLHEAVNGWTLIKEHNPVSGMHALAYQVSLFKSFARSIFQ